MSRSTVRGGQGRENGDLTVVACGIARITGEFSVGAWNSLGDFAIAPAKGRRLLTFVVCGKGAILMVADRLFAGLPIG
jgi:hypothetical protein